MLACSQAGSLKVLSYDYVRLFWYIEVIMKVALVFLYWGTFWKSRIVGKKFYLCNGGISSFG